MGMLLHHTWLEEQKKKSAKAKPEEKPVEDKEPEAEPVKKTGGRRKSK